MSFILDALKKSEAERQREASPGIADVPVGSRVQQAPRWLRLVAVLLAINLIALFVILLRPEGLFDGDAPRAAASRPTPTAANAVSEAPAVDEAPRRAMTTDPPPNERAVSTAQNPITTAETMPPVSAPAVETPAAPAQESATEAVTAPASEPDEAWLTLNELRASGAVDLPDMHIDLHVYSTNPAERFVFINMNQYRENAVLDNGSRIRRITPDGVVLDYRGTQILLPRE